MGTVDETRIPQVVTCFRKARQSGRRASIDEVLDGFPNLADREGTRAEALRRIAEGARTQSLPGGSSGAGGLEAGLPAELPELEGYDIIDIVGRGGMGMVYEAYQRSTKRRVAVKFMLDAAASTETARRRFEREVELVARLQHPNIVSVVDSGIHRGRYFYVMEYVEGLPLDEAVPLGACDVRETLRLIAVIAEAVDYAHQRGVLHRDLKPGNILVVDHTFSRDLKRSASPADSSPITHHSSLSASPKILDFGLAKAIDPGSGPGLRMTLSEPGQLLGTLGYMPPEQAAGRIEEMSVRSDVYSLGAIAYELITGRLPCGAEGPLGEVLERIAQQDPPRPASLRRQLDKDVEAILLKALEKSPQRRYATMAEFSADIQRLLEHKPILARRSGVATRAARWVRRNRSVSAVVAIAIGIVTVLTGLSLVRIATEQNKVRAEAKKAHQVNSFFRDMLLMADPHSGKGRELTLREVLDEISPRAAQEFAEQPEVLAELEQTLGATYANLGALDTAQSHLRSALQVSERLYGPEHVSVAKGLSALVGYFVQKGDYTSAEELFPKAEELCLRLASTDESAAGALLTLGAARRNSGDSARGRVLLSDALSLYERHYPKRQSRIAEILRNLAECMLIEGQADTAEAFARRAIEIQRRELGAEHSQLAETLDTIAAILLRQGQFVAAEATSRAAMIMRRKLFGRDHVRNVVGLGRLAEVLRASGRLDEAEAACREAIAILAQLGRGDDDANLAEARLQLAQILETKGQSESADELYRKILPAYRKGLGANPRQLAAMLDTIAASLYSRGSYSEAEALLGEALAALAPLRPTGYDPQVAWVRNRLASVLSAIGRSAEAIELYERAIEAYRSTPGHAHANLGSAICDYAGHLSKMGDYVMAERLYREALEILQAPGSPLEHPEAAFVLQSLGDLLISMGRYAEAKSFLEQAVAAYRSELSEFRPLLAVALRAYGSLLYSMGDFTAAEVALREALALHHAGLGPKNNESAVLSELSRCRQALGGEDAEALISAALELDREHLGYLSVAVAIDLTSLGDCLRDRGDYEQAEVHYRESIGLLRELPDGNVYLGLPLANLGTFLADRGDFVLAEEKLRAALDSLRSAYGEEHSDVAWCLSHLARTRAVLCEPEEATMLFDTALAMQRKLLPAGHVDIAGSLVRYGEFHCTQGRPHDAEPLLLEAILIYAGALPCSHRSRTDADVILGRCLTALGRQDEAEGLFLASYESLRTAPHASQSQRDEVLVRIIDLYEHWGKRGKAAEWRAKLPPASGSQSTARMALTP